MSRFIQSEYAINLKTFLSESGLPCRIAAPIRRPINSNKRLIFESISFSFIGLKINSIELFSSKSAVHGDHQNWNLIIRIHILKFFTDFRYRIRITASAIINRFTNKSDFPATTLIRAIQERFAKNSARILIMIEFLNFHGY